MVQERPYLKGTRFTISTDHNAFRWLVKMSDASSRLARWTLCMAEFDYEVTCRPSLKHYAADAFSRILTNGTDLTSLHDEILTIRERPQDQDDDPEYRDLVVEVTIGQWKDNEPVVMMCTIDWEAPLSSPCTCNGTRGHRLSSHPYVCAQPIGTSDYACSMPLRVQRCPRLH